MGQKVYFLFPYLVVYEMCLTDDAFWLGALVIGHA